MLKIKKLISSDFIDCYKLLKIYNRDLDYFRSMGWSLQQFKKQFSKNIFYGLGIYKNKNLQGFIIGDLINIKNVIDYELLIIYISVKKRELGYATKLHNDIQLTLQKHQLNKIYLEVAANNTAAINFYLKNGYEKLGVRKKYYFINNNKIDAYTFEKLINE